MLYILACLILLIIFLRKTKEENLEKDKLVKILQNKKYKKANLTSVKSDKSYDDINVFGPSDIRIEEKRSNKNSDRNYDNNQSEINLKY